MSCGGDLGGEGPSLEDFLVMLRGGTDYVNGTLEIQAGITRVRKSIDGTLPTDLVVFAPKMPKGRPSRPETIQGVRKFAPASHPATIPQPS